MAKYMMKKSTKFLVGSTFSLFVVFGAGELFQQIGLVYGLPQTIGAAVAGAIGATRLLSGA